MSSAANGQPPSLTQIPTDRVVRLVGLTDEQLAVSLDPLPTGVPVVIRHSIGRHGQSQHDVVDEALAELEAMAANLYPAWLPDAGEMPPAATSTCGWSGNSPIGTQPTAPTLVRFSPTWRRQRSAGGHPSALRA